MTATVIISRYSVVEEERQALEDRLVSLCVGTPGLEVLLVPHLYHLSDACGAWEHLQHLQGDVVIVSWLHPRPAEWLARRQGMAPERLIPLNLGAYESAEACFAAIAEQLGPIPASEGARGQARELREETASRWYPVVDLSRCANCGHCLQFCLFGVYAQDEQGRLVVANPDQCKPGCPACSRICPEGAIMFPAYERDEAVAGAPGKLMAPDLFARRVFYSRTKKLCPVCGSTPERPGSLPEATPGAVCQECARELQAVVLPEPSRTPPDPAYDEIDTLIDDLDKLVRRRG